MVAVSTPRFTEREYLALEGVAEVRHEFVQGDIVAMSGAEPEHNQIAQNVRFELEAQVRARRCRVAGSDQRVVAEAVGEYFYPDVVMTCSEPRYVEPSPRSLANPELIVEVLSPSTEARDRGAKWLAYQTITSLQDYLLISTKRRQIEHYSRVEEGWLLRKVEEGVVRLREGLELAVDDVYRLVELVPFP